MVTFHLSLCVNNPFSDRPRRKLPSHRSTPICASNTGRENVLGLLWAFYLVTTLSYGGDEFADYHIYTLQCGLLQLLDLLFHYGLKGKVRGEQPRPV